MFYKLIKNEWVKISRPMGTKIAIALILLAAIVIPLYSQMTQQPQTKLMQTDNALLLLEEQLSKTPDSIEGQIRHLNYQAEQRYWQLADQIKLETFDWRIDLMKWYQNDLVMAAYLQAILDGIPIEQVLLHGMNFEYTTIEELIGSDEATLKERVEYHTAQAATYESIAIANDFIAGTKLYIEWIDEMVANLEQQIAQLQAEDVNNADEITSKVTTINSYLGRKEILEYRIAHDIAYEETDWKSATLLRMETLNFALYENIVSEGTFYTYGYGKFETYEEYLQAVDIKVAGRQSEMDALWHSLHTDQPVMETDSLDVRYSVYFTLEVLVMMVSIFIILMGSGIVASEFSKGTIRMLLSRPVSRGQIYLAKMSTLLLIGVALLLVSGVLSIVAGGIVYGFSDYGIAVFEAVDGVINSQHFFAFLAGEIVLSLGGMIASIGLIMLLSTVSKSTVVTVGATMILYLLSAPLSAMIADVAFVPYTIFPYMNVGLIRLVQSFSDSFWGQGINLNLQLGFVGMLAFSAVLAAIGYVHFVKKDVRN